MEGADEWFYVVATDERGPCSRERLQELLGRGEIGADTMIRKRSWMEWREVRTLSVLSAKPSQANPSYVASSPSVDTEVRSVEPALPDSPTRMKGWCVTGILAVTSVAVLAAGIVVFHAGNYTAAPPVGQDSKTAFVGSASEKAGQQPVKQVDWETMLADVPVASGRTGQEVAKKNGDRLAQHPVAERPAAHASGKMLDPVALYANCRAAVVTILTKDDSGLDACQGTGFFIPGDLVGARYALHALTKNGHPWAGGTLVWAYVITNYHVIRSAATAEVRLDDGGSGEITEVIMEREDLDLAVVFVAYHRTNDSKPIAPLRIAEGPSPPIGQKVYAIGSPKGLEASLSDGIISGRREVGEGSYWLQTTAPVSPGSSGGPLLDATGQVVGVVIAQRRGGQNLNFAVPASEVIKLLTGPINTRQLWRGSGINAEEDDAYSSARFASWSLKKKGKVTGEFLEFLSKGKEKIGSQPFGDQAYARSLESMGRTAAGQMGGWEYLLHFTIGRFAALRAFQSEAAAFAASNSFSAEQHQSIARVNKDEQLAETCFAKAIQLNPGFSPSYLYLGESLAQQGRFGEALKVVEQLLRRVPRCARVYNLRGYCYKELDRELDALAELKMAAELAPSDPDNYVELGGCCLGLREYEQAIDAYETAIRLAPKSPNSALCYLNMSTCYERMGKTEQAKACLEKIKTVFAR